MRQCSYDPRDIKKSWGLFDCPECGMLVQAGLPHPNQILNIQKNQHCENCACVKQEVKRES